MHRIGHGGTDFAVDSCLLLIRLEIDVGADRSMQQRLRWSEIVAQWRLGALRTALH